MKTRLQFALVLVIAGLLATGLYAQLDAPSRPWPPALPGIDGTVSLTDAGFLKIPDVVTERLTQECAAPFVMARHAPTVELAFHGDLPHDGRNRTGWTTWGDIGIASNGKVYSGIGDHGADAEGTANAYIYEWDPATKTLRQVVDINKVVPRSEGQPTWSKVHAKVDEGPDGWIYFTGTLNDGQKAGQEQYKWSETFPGGQLLRYNPATGQSEVFANLPPARASATSMLDRKNNIWWCNLEAGGGNALFAINLSTRQPVLQTEDGVVTQNRNFMLAADGSVYFNGRGGFWRANPHTGEVTQTKSALPNGGNVRGSTRESSDGYIYGVTYRPGRMFRYHPGRDELTMLGPDFLCGDYTTVMDLSPDERFLYYMPGAHGQARTIGTPVIQYHIATGQRKVLAFLKDPFEAKHAFVPAGTYGMKISDDGRTIYTCINGHPGDDYRPSHLSANGFSLTAFMVIHIPEQELRDPQR
jgi:sugar lactone lactonase YvrE